MEEIALYVDAAITATGTPIEGNVHYSNSGQESITRAHSEAKRGLSRSIELGHLFVALISPQKDSHLDEVLAPFDLKINDIRTHLYKTKGQMRVREEDGLTEGMKRALDAAQNAMRTTFCGRITPLHLLLGLLENRDSLALEALNHAKINLEELRARIKREIVNDNEMATAQKRYSKAAQRALHRAQYYAVQSGYRFVAPEHLLLALLPQDIPLDIKLIEKQKFGTVEEYPQLWHDYDLAAITAYLIFDIDAAKAASKKKTRTIPFTKEARNVVLFGQAEANKMNAGHVGTEHLLLGLLLEQQGTASHVLLKMGVTPDKVRQQIEAEARTKPDSSNAEADLTSKAERVLERVDDEALDLRHKYIGTEHLLLALMREEEGLGAIILRRFGLNLEKTRAQVMEYMVPHRSPKPSILRRIRKRFSRR